MRVEPYLMFAGCCDEALACRCPPAGTTRSCTRLEVGDTLVMAPDGMSREVQSLVGVTLSISADSEAQARCFFDALAEGGSVFMPMGPTFWSPCCGMCSDRFGVRWRVGLDGPQT